MSVSSIPHKILSSGIVPVYFDGQRYRVLALRAFDDWDFPKALVEGQEDPLEAALRHTRERTGLDELQLDWGDAFRETVAAEDGSVSRYYLAQSRTADVELNVPAGEGASEDFEHRWVTPEEAEDILPPRLAIVLDWAVRQLAAG
jgi:8-oxo-dGTP pyrophosphatase MutT (NUDIX family)